MKEVKIIILAGGKGKRLWPLSVEEAPKPFCKIFSERTLIEETIERVKGMGEIFILAEKRYIEYAKKILGTSVAYLEEPKGEDTGSAFFFAASQFSEETLLLFLPSDHYIKEIDPLQRRLSEGVFYAKKGKIIAFGITPQGAETRFGYIKVEKDFSIQSFYEKPSKNQVEKLLQNRAIYWNTGIYFSKAQTIVEESKKYGVTAGVSFDKGVMEKTDKGMLLPVEMQWNDLGTWSAAMEYLAPLSQKKGLVTLKESQNTQVYSDGIEVKIVGLDNIMVVLTANGLLISHRDKIGEIKDL